MRTCTHSPPLAPGCARSQPHMTQLRSHPPPSARTQPAHLTPRTQLSLSLPSPHPASAP
ncbi:hypothetical protein FIBSPDRAFT_876612 [Athelia psychrophila]|uniref:Uncharacterized protein n=1 Tax=Athelia psychrophila TaxID=1759441 RepID=A0A167WQM0_9AGAM|nr:hypothetical protein FIBSPDRAFT_876612 [Fibularhizoctonia sp. CBS 109695]